MQLLLWFCGIYICFLDYLQNSCLCIIYLISCASQAHLPFTLAWNIPTSILGRAALILNTSSLISVAVAAAAVLAAAVAVEIFFLLLQLWQTVVRGGVCGWELELCCFKLFWILKFPVRNQLLLWGACIFVHTWSLQSCGIQCLCFV